MYIALLIILCTGTGYAQPPEFQSIQSGSATVLFEEPLRSVARDVAQSYPSLSGELGSKLELSTDFPHEVLLLKDHRTFARAAGTDLITAFAQGGRRLVVVDFTHMNEQPWSFGETLKHELCHLVLHEQVVRNAQEPGKVFIPRWLNEGLCQWASGGASELRNLGKRPELMNAVLGNRLLPLYRLERTFPGDARGLRLAYEQSRSAVEFMVSEFGYEKVKDILVHLREGTGMDRAVYLSLGISHREFEEKWQASLKTRYTWVTWFSNNIHIVVFVFGGVVLVLAFIRAVWKMVTYKDDDDDNTYDPASMPPPPGSSTGLRKLRSRRKGKHRQEED